MVSLGFLFLLARFFYGEGRHVRRLPRMPPGISGIRVLASFHKSIALGCDFFFLPSISTCPRGQNLRSHFFNLVLFVGALRSPDRPLVFRPFYATSHSGSCWFETLDGASPFFPLFRKFFFSLPSPPFFSLFLVVPRSQEAITGYFVTSLGLFF